MQVLVSTAKCFSGLHYVYPKISNHATPLKIPVRPIPIPRMLCTLIVHTVANGFDC